MKIIIAVFLAIPLILTGRLHAQVSGCTDSLAANFNPAATINDGSCIYNSTSIAPVSSYTLSSQIAETSGLVIWNNNLWTHNDNSDTHLYCLDTLNGNILQTVLLENIVNTDWEEISQDTEFLYIGDFGNNLNGNRIDLKILRIAKTSVIEGNPEIDTINFHYADQLDFTPTGANSTDFDCEAMIVSADSIYLFTKQWVSRETAVYSLPKIPGEYAAAHLATYDIDGLITGATFLEPQRLVVLSGYSGLLSPFTWLLYDFNGHDFFGGNKRKINISLSFHQVEAVSTSDGLKIYMTNENFIQPPIINNPQQLHIFDFSPFLSGYLNNLMMNVEVAGGQREVFIYPNPSAGFVSLRVADSLADEEFQLLNAGGRALAKGHLIGHEVIIDLSSFRSGIYLLKIGKGFGNTIKLIRR